MKVIFLRNSTVISPWSAYFQYLFVGLIFFLEGVAVAIYADDTTLYSASKTNDLVIKEVEHFPKFFLNGLTLTT